MVRRALTVALIRTLNLAYSPGPSPKPNPNPDPTKSLALISPLPRSFTPTPTLATPNCTPSPGPNPTLTPTRYSDALQDDLVTELDVEMYSDFRQTHLHTNATHDTSLRRRPTLGAPEPAWRRVTCETTEKARQRFSAYLDALQARPRQDVGGIGYHAYPQAMKVNIVTRAAPRFDAIVKLEELGAGLERVGALAGTPPVVVPPPTKTEAHSNERLACARFGIGAQLTRRLCKLYAVDFECFGYELPEVCRG